MKNNRIKSRILFISLILGSTLVAFSQTIPTGDRLKDIKIPSGCKIGTMLDDYHNEIIANREFNTISSLWYPAWGGYNGVEIYNFNSFNKRINWARDKGKTTIMHCFVGHNRYWPGWFVNGTWTNSELERMLRDMIYSLLESNSNKTKIDICNVVNELFNDDGTYRSTQKLIQLGWEDDASGLSGLEKVNNQHPVFIGKAFQYVRNKTNAKLELRDFNITIPDVNWGWSRKHNAIYQLLKHMLAKGYPVDAIGEQAHLNIGNLPPLASVKKAIQKFKALGIEVYITELDIAVNKWSKPSTWGDIASLQQKNDFKKYVNTVIDAGVSIINVCGTTDGDPFWQTDGHHLLFDKNNDPKPAYYGFQEALYSYNLSTSILNTFYKTGQNILVYPNPVSSNLTIKFENSNNSPFEIRLMDSSSRLLKSIEFSGNQGNLNIEGFSKGLYFLQLRSETSSITRKLLIE